MSWLISWRTPFKSFGLRERRRIRRLSRKPKLLKGVRHEINHDIEFTNRAARLDGGVCAFGAVSRPGCGTDDQTQDGAELEISGAAGNVLSCGRQRLLQGRRT